MPNGTLTMEVRVDEVVYDGYTTRIRVDLGNSCFLSFTINSKVKVPPFIEFTANLEHIKEQIGGASHE